MRGWGLCTQNARIYVYIPGRERRGVYSKCQNIFIPDRMRGGGLCTQNARIHKSLIERAAVVYTECQHSVGKHVGGRIHSLSVG